jgi:hypothetical protein
MVVSCKNTERVPCYGYQRMDTATRERRGLEAVNTQPRILENNNYDTLMPSGYNLATSQSKCSRDATN